MGGIVPLASYAVTCLETSGMCETTENVQQKYWLHQQRLAYRSFWSAMLIPTSGTPAELHFFFFNARTTCSTWWSKRWVHVPQPYTTLPCLHAARCFGTPRASNVLSGIEHGPYKKVIASDLPVK